MTLILPALALCLPHAPAVLLLCWIVGAICDLTDLMENPDE